MAAPRRSRFNLVGGAELQHGSARNELPGLDMADKPLSADGIHASALPNKPPRPSLISPAVVSAAVGSSMGLPAGSIALPAAQPLTGEATSSSTSTSTKHLDGLPGLGQSHVPALVSAAVALPKVQIPEINNQRGVCGAAGTGGQSTASTMCGPLPPECPSGTQSAGTRATSCVKTEHHLRRDFFVQRCTPPYCLS